MLFKNYLYVNETLLERLAQQLKIKMSTNVVKTNQISKKTGFAAKALQAEVAGIQTDTEKIENDKFDLLAEFESELAQDDTGIVDFDFDEADHILAGQLIEFRATMLQPKLDDNMEIINSIKDHPFISELMITELSGEDKKLMDLVLKSKNIPVYFSNDEKYIVLSNINMEWLDVPYEDFQELFNEEVKVLMIVDRKYNEEQEVVLMDLLKDTFKIGRSFRRAMDKSEQDKYLVKEQGPAIKGEILAIYN